MKSERGPTDSRDTGTSTLEEVVEIPSDIDAVLKRLLDPRQDGANSVLASEDEAYLNSSHRLDQSGPPRRADRRRR